VTETGLKPRETKNKTDLKEKEGTNLEANPEKLERNAEMMQSEVEHQEVPTEEATVKSLGTMKKRHRLASSCRTTQRAKGTNTKRLWISMEVGCHLQEGVPSCSSDTVQQKRLQGDCGPRKELATAGMRMTHSTKVAQHGT
jgi:hypothetical protein